MAQQVVDCAPVRNSCSLYRHTGGGGRIFELYPCGGVYVPQDGALVCLDFVQGLYLLYEPDLNGQGRELVVRKNAAINTFWGSTNKWANSNHRAWCNGGFKSRFSAAVQSAMGQTTYEYTEGEGNRTLKTRADAAWELSVYESVPSWQSMYDTYMDKEGEPIPMRSALFPCYNDSGVMATWSTRSPRYKKLTGQDYNVNYYDDDGREYPAASNPTSNYYSRPCFCLPSTAFVDINLNLDETSLVPGALNS